METKSENCGGHSNGGRLNRTMQYGNEKNSVGDIDTSDV